MTRAGSATVLVMDGADENTRRMLADVAARHAEGLDVLVLHGSRARGDASPRSDWDFAYLGSEGFDLGGLLADLSFALNTDHVDAAELSRASAVLRFRAARDGVLLYERRAGLFDAFAVEAATFWCDVANIVRNEYGDLLDGLAR